MPLNLTVSALIIFGGIGYQVIIESYFWLVRKVKKSQRPFAFSLNLRVVVRVTIFLLLLGFFGILILEAQGNRAFAQFSFQDRLLVAWFQSVTTRTAGFNTIDLNELSSTSLVLVMLLMFIGASPSGTGGGIKTTTFAILANCTRSALRGQERVIIDDRCIPPQLILKAIAVVFGSMVTVISSISLLIFLESEQEAVSLAFEAVSAFATVGLSLGTTPELKPLSQLVLIVTMFIGRVGITILMAAIVGDPKPSLIKYPEENLLVG